MPRHAGAVYYSCVIFEPCGAMDTTVDDVISCESAA